MRPGQVEPTSPLGEGDDATRAECRQKKRQTKQDAPEAARDIKQND